MAISTYKTFLMVKETSTWTKVIDVKSYPDLGGAPEMIEVTTLSDGSQVYIAGIQSTESLSFEANYTKTNYAALKALEGSEKDYAVWFGGTEAAGVVTPTGADGKFSFKGELSAYPTGGGVNEPVGIQITIAPSTPISSED